MKSIISFLFLIISFTIVAQNSMNRDVPEVVFKTFNKKFPKAEDIAWDKVDTNFIAEFFFRGIGTYAEFTPSGSWVQTITDLDLKTLYPPVQKYIDENFAKDKIVFAEKAMKSDKHDYYYVQLARKDKQTKETHTIELFFDKTGQIDQVKLPEGINDQTVVGIDDPNIDTPAEVIDSWQKRFPKAENIEWSKQINPSDTIDFDYTASFVYREQITKATFYPDGYWVETRVEYEEKNLYAPVLKYIEENHWDDDLIIAEKVTRNDRNDYYYVKMERFVKGQFRPYVFELFFDKSGKIKEVIRPQELKNQYLLTVDIPEPVAKKFKSRFSTAEDVKWETSEGDWKATFTYRDLPTTALFSDSAQWIMTISEMDIKNIYAPVQRTLDSEYSDYRVMYAEKATRKDRNDHYYVELISKKKNLQPQKLGLFFDKTGRLKED
ncbi:MAG: PepSY-like domain-containing protein [Bacteroidales bacterium]